MTDRLRDDLDALNALVGRAADRYGVSAAYIEKDFWVTETLRSASVRRPITRLDGTVADTTFVFKGGTSLSRVFGIIERFSEDVDLLAVFPEPTSPAARHKVLKQVDADVSAHLGVRGEVVPDSSTTGVKRYTTYRYPVEQPDNALKERVLLELGSRGGTQPIVIRQYQSMVAEFAIADLGDNENTWEEFAAFEVSVLSPERTLLEKIAAVHDAASRNDADTLARSGRHFYDIFCLLTDAQVQKALNLLAGEGIAALADDINRHSEQAGFSWSPRPLGGYADSPAFDCTHASREAIAAGYQAAQDLIYGQRPALDEITAAVSFCRDLL